MSFDLDHTLWDFDKNEITFEGIFQRNHLAIQNIHRKYVPINQACWKLYQYDKISHEELRYNRLRHSFDAINYSVSDAQIEIIAKSISNYYQITTSFFDAFEILDYLNENYKLHIITNGFAGTRKKKFLSCMIIFILSQTLIWLG
jgi:putative hydrolase of the HAD superfamily